MQEPWYPGETVIAGIGQGFNVVTPLQLANAVAALVNGGILYSPILLYAAKSAGVERAKRISAPVAFEIPVRDPQDWQTILDGMDLVVNGSRGTAKVWPLMPISGQVAKLVPRRCINLQPRKRTTPKTWLSICAIMPGLSHLHR